MDAGVTRRTSDWSVAGKLGARAGGRHAARMACPVRFLTLPLMWLGICEARVSAADLTVADLRCDAMQDPLGVDSAPPRLSWQLRSDMRGAWQSGWQVLVASSAENLARDRGDVWDSGKMTGDRQLDVAVAGRALASAEKVFWKVRAWDGADQPSAWSPSATWTMGVLALADWHAQWITAAARQADNATLLVRREFTVKPGLRRALAHVTGLGAYELSLNGRKVGDDLLAPGWTTYEKTVLYDTHDITTLLRAGPNAAGIFLGNGMYSVQKVAGRFAKFTNDYRPPFARAQLRLEYTDGTVEFVGTDGAWRTHAGAITISQVYSGEDFDARLEPAGWDRAGFDDATWPHAVVSAAGPGGKLFGASHAAPPVRAQETLKPVAVKEIRPGVAVYDLGQNVSLMPRLRVHGAPGGVVKITGAELVKPDGTVDRGSMGGSRGDAYWSYTLAGRAGGEDWFSKFFYSGCRYLQIERTAPAGGGLPAVSSSNLPVVDLLEGVVVHSSSLPAGEFECSDDLFNRIHLLVRWAQRSNMMTVLTDCPHREKLGWLEQYHLNGPALRYEFDLTRLYAKTFSDMADAQTADGLVPDIAPEYVTFKDGFRDSPEWGSALLLAAWQHYVWTSDDVPLRAHYEAMQRYVAYFDGKATNRIASHGLGDWFDIGPGKLGASQLTPIALTATAFLYHDIDTLAAIARVLGRTDDAAGYAREAEKVRTAFNVKFFHPDTGSYATGSQCANALPLAFGLVAPGDRARVLDALVRDTREHNITAGDVGYEYLLRALAEGGRSDVVFEINHQSEKLGYGYQLAHGATSLTESWGAERGKSQNHFMLGQINEWFYGELAGLAPDPGAPGFRNVIIKPQPVAGISWARATHESPRGKISSFWKREAGRLTLEVEIPPNATATVWMPAVDSTRAAYAAPMAGQPGLVAMPAPDPARVTEGGVTPAERNPGVRQLRTEPGAVVYAIGSGRYVFSAPTW